MKTKRVSNNIVEVDGERYIREDLRGWLDIPELNISVEIEVHDKNTSWDDLDLEKRENELLTAEQCIFLTNSKYAKQLKMDGSSTKDDFFIKQPFELNKKNGYVALFYAVSDRVGVDSCYDSYYRNSDLGVRFCRPLKEDGK